MAIPDGSRSVAPFGDHVTGRRWRRREVREREGEHVGQGRDAEVVRDHHGRRARAFVHQQQLASGRRGGDVVCLFLFTVENGSVSREAGTGKKKKKREISIRGGGYGGRWRGGEGACRQQGRGHDVRRTTTGHRLVALAWPATCARRRRRNPRDPVSRVCLSPGRGVGMVSGPVASLGCCLQVNPHPLYATHTGDQADAVEGLACAAVPPRYSVRNGILRLCLNHSHCG